ncbi:MAG: 2-oxoacid:acceptor oxidoreductase family protein [Methanomassiliicoccaceae archaeon]|nr:pyruvate ferredoxin oxidoreductase [Euryarchaeota archaeon]HOB37487.1 2-oxoacid:acceptor oxidoreductase family protein [Methanomassiliicoccaceae archaeon]HOL07974.1 2-oxoacid:acceptor oxidoreductase family protein [Methanomassiliicoccaceae archaeon]HOQ25528.1 2-oxoacid:acceptor oxidoreductase family protein [Methanomassiliicoccaceae archaeon]HQA22067.1 2-oxoacid:acceptor oxidoreductase family protein [Methanomassiliicoccaceae archaeon]
MIEIRFHGRGGQGAVLASEILARAAIMEGLSASAFPFFGVERKGSPVTAFCRIDRRPIRLHTGIYEPDHVVVLDQALIRLTDVLSGLKEDGTVLVNSPHKAEELGLPTDRRLATVDATSIALTHHLGSPSAPIVNTAILGGLARQCDIIPIDAVLDAIRYMAPARKEENAQAALETYERGVR